MTTLLIGLLIFLGVHSIRIAAPAWRERVVQQRGPLAWKGIYAVAALLGFVLIVVGYGQARDAPIVLYTPPTAFKHAALLLLVPVFPLLIATYLPGRISAAAKHPMLLATKLWALAHLLANGSLADVLLFGSFLVWAVADRILAKQRGGATPPAGQPRNDAIAIVAGLAVYAAFIGGVHRWLIGVSPL